MLGYWLSEQLASGLPGVSHFPGPASAHVDERTSDDTSGKRSPSQGGYCTPICFIRPTWS